MISTTRNTDPAAGARQEHGIAADLIAAALRATERLDLTDLRDLLDRGAVELGQPAMLHKFVAPFAVEVGERWRRGELNIAHEHFATSAITVFLSSFARPYPAGNSAHHLVVATPTGQMHELGAIIAVAAAQSHGWRGTYLGSSLPIEELVGAATQLKARAIGLSIVFPPDDIALTRDLLKLPKLLPPECAVIVGGRSVQTYAETLQEVKAIKVNALEELYPVLDSLQQTKRGSGSSDAK